MTINAITDTKKGRTGIAPTYLHTTPTLSVTVCGSVGIADNHLVKCVKILRNGHNEPHLDHTHYM